MREGSQNRTLTDWRRSDCLIMYARLRSAGRRDISVTALAKHSELYRIFLTYIEATLYAPALEEIYSTANSASLSLLALDVNVQTEDDDDDEDPPSPFRAYLTLAQIR